MKEDKAHEYIEKQDPEGKSALKAKIMAQLPKESAPERTPVRNKRQVFSWVTACFCAVCLAVALPLLISQSKSSAERFSYTSNDFFQYSLTQTLKEYAAENNLPLLYLDYYEKPGMEVYTNRYVLKNGKQAFFINEIFADGDIDVEINIIDKKISIQAYESFWNFPQKYEVDGVVVYWVHQMQESCAVFTYKNYNYFIILNEPKDSGRILQVVQDLLQTK